MILNHKQVAALTATVLLAAASNITFAEEYRRNNLYIGGGVNFNTFGFGNATGIQVLGGYQFNAKLNGDISSAVEIGYMDSGNFNNNNNIFGNNNNDAQGVWLAMVESVPVSNRVNALVRVGVDLGDDDGLMVGAGMGYNFNSQTALRTEYVVRDNINCFQFKVLFRI
ncbi:MAG: outer membrane beta-barrel protein [Gammaproteobacteria bacterium]